MHVILMKYKTKLLGKYVLHFQFPIYQSEGSERQNFEVELGGMTKIIVLKKQKYSHFLFIP
jgi:hypothetical protein